MALRFLEAGSELDRLARSAMEAADALRGLFRNHRELLALETREEIGASMRLAVLLGAALFAGAMLCVALTALALLKAEEGFRPALLLALALVYGGASLAGAVALFFRLRRHAAWAAPLLKAAKEAEAALLGEGRGEEAAPSSGSTPPSPEGRRPARQGTRTDRERQEGERGETCGRGAAETVEGESCFWFDDEPR